MSNPTEEAWRKAIADGTASIPFLHALGTELVGLKPGWVSYRLPFSEKLLGDAQKGIVHGGVITTLLDHTCGIAVGSALRAPRSFVTLDLRIDYMKAASPGADLLFDGECLKIGHDVAFSRAVAYHDSKDTPIATGTATFMFTAGGAAAMPYNMK